MRYKFRAVTTLAAAAALSFLLAAPALAHGEAGHGDLVLTIGFVDEPAYAGMPNGVQLIVEHDGEPVTDLKPGDVQVEVSYGDETSEPMDMEPAFFFEGKTLVYGEPGDYHADFVPSQPGEYTFHFMGTIDGEEVDEEMTSGPETFSVVEDVAAASFPAVEAPTSEELATRLDQEAQRTDDAVTQAEAAASDAQSAADSAKTLAMLGLLVGTIGVIAAIIALVTRKRA